MSWCHTPFSRLPQSRKKFLQDNESQRSNETIGEVTAEKKWAAITAENTFLFFRTWHCCLKRKCGCNLFQLSSISIFLDEYKFQFQLFCSFLAFLFSSHFRFSMFQQFLISILCRNISWIFKIQIFLVRLQIVNFLRLIINLINFSRN